MVISRELSTVHDKSLQRNGSGNYVSEANYIEFSNVKVIKIIVIFPFSLLLVFILVVFSLFHTFFLCVSLFSL